MEQRDDVQENSQSKKDVKKRNRNKKMNRNNVEREKEQWFDDGEVREGSNEREIPQRRKGRSYTGGKGGGREEG